MKRIFAAIACSVLMQPAFAEPGVTLLLNSREPSQARQSALAKRCLYLLMKANELSGYQFSLKTADFADPRTADHWRRQFDITSKELPALALTRHNGNKLTVENLIRRYKNPQSAAESAFHCLQGSFPNLVHHDQIETALNVTSSPPGAAIRVDSQLCGETPGQIMVSPGPHRVELAHPDCLPWGQTVRAELGESVEVASNLERDSGQVKIESTGVPLAISVDGSEPLNTPWTQQLAAGSHRVRATAPGLYEYEAEFHATAGKVTSVRLTPVEAKVRVGLGDLQAVGYQGVYEHTSGTGCHQTYWLEPYEVVLDPNDLMQRVEEHLGQDKTMQLLPAKEPNDCQLNFEIKSTRDEVVGFCKVMDGQGQVLQTYKCQRDMPFLTFDEQGSANVRSREVVEDMSKFLREYLKKSIQPGRVAPAELQTPLQVVVEERQ